MYNTHAYVIGGVGETSVARAHIKSVDALVDEQRTNAGELILCFIGCRYTAMHSSSATKLSSILDGFQCDGPFLKIFTFFVEAIYLLSILKTGKS